MCGCHMDPVDDRETPCDLCSEATEGTPHVGWRIVRCSLHAKAPNLHQLVREAFEITAAWHDGMETSLDPRDWLKAARRVLGEIEGGKL